MDINAFARTLHQAPAPTLKWIAWADGSPAQLNKTTANPRTQPVAYLAEAEIVLEKHADAAALKAFIAGELKTVGADTPVAVRDLGAMAAVHDALANECAQLGLRLPIGGSTVTLANLGRVYAALAEKRVRCVDVPVMGDKIFDDFMQGGAKPEVYERLRNTAASLYDTVQRRTSPQAKGLGLMLAKATRDADPKITNGFFDLIDSLR